MKTADVCPRVVSYERRPVGRWLTNNNKENCEEARSLTMYLLTSAMPPECVKVHSTWVWRSRVLCGGDLFGVMLLHPSLWKPGTYPFTSCLQVLDPVCQLVMSATSDGFLNFATHLHQHLSVFTNNTLAGCTGELVKSSVLNMTDTFTVSGWIHVGREWYTHRLHIASCITNEDKG